MNVQLPNAKSFLSTSDEYLIASHCECDTVGDTSTEDCCRCPTHRLLLADVPTYNTSVILSTKRDEVPLIRREGEGLDLNLVQHQPAIQRLLLVIPHDHVCLEPHVGG